MKKEEKWFWLFAAVCVILNLGILGFIIWAIIKVLQYLGVV